MSDLVKFSYKNHRGEIAVRQVIVHSIVYRFDSDTYLPSWFLKCRDYTNGRDGLWRDFALANIVFDRDHMFVLELRVSNV